MGSSSTPEFGHAFRAHFLFDSKFTNMNHGSFGTYPATVRDVANGFRALCEEAPDKFLRYHFVDLLDESRTQIARLLNVPSEECVFVQNATSGVNTILRNLPYVEKDCIIYFSTIYGALEKTLFSIVESTPQLQLRKVPYRLPCTHNEIVDAFSQTISQASQDGLTPKLCIYETIASVPGVRMPFERITTICREKGILSLLDGAHGVGQIPLDLARLDADFFISNCHKWLFTPRGCAIFHVPKRNQYLIRTTFPTSWGWLPPDPTSSRNPTGDDLKSHFVNMFAYVGTADTSAYYCVPAALEFRRSICGGEEAVYTYIRDIAQRGAALLAKLLGTEVMDDQPKGEQRIWSGGLRDCALANVLLPLAVTRAQASRDGMNIEPWGSDPAGGLIIVDEEDLESHTKWMTRILTEEYNVGVTIYPYDNKVWIRVSGQIYLELKDFVLLARVLKEVLDRVRSGESSQSSRVATVKGANIES